MLLLFNESLITPLFNQSFLILHRDLATLPSFILYLYGILSLSLSLLLSSPLSQIYLLWSLQQFSKSFQLLLWIFEPSLSLSSAIPSLPLWVVSQDGKLISVAPRLPFSPCSVYNTEGLGVIYFFSFLLSPSPLFAEWRGRPMNCLSKMPMPW